MQGVCTADTIVSMSSMISRALNELKLSVDKCGDAIRGIPDGLSPLFQDLKTFLSMVLDNK